MCNRRVLPSIEKKKARTHTQKKSVTKEKNATVNLVLCCRFCSGINVWILNIGAAILYVAKCTDCIQCEYTQKKKFSLWNDTKKSVVIYVLVQCATKFSVNHEIRILHSIQEKKKTNECRYFGWKKKFTMSKLKTTKKNCISLTLSLCNWIKHLNNIAFFFYKTLPLAVAFQKLIAFEWLKQSQTLISNY